MIALREREDEAYYREVEKFAEKTGQLEQLRKQLWILHTYGECGDPRFEGQRTLDPLTCEGTEKSRAWLYRDFAPCSFDVRLERRVSEEGESGTSGETRYEPWMHLGLLYHGSHDGFGSGSAPTFAVSIESVQGWSIHS